MKGFLLTKYGQFEWQITKEEMTYKRLGKNWNPWVHIDNLQIKKMREIGGISAQR